MTMLEKLQGRLRNLAQYPWDFSIEMAKEVAEEAAALLRTQAARIAELEAVLHEMASQTLSSHMDDETFENADFEAGYDMLINLARAAWVKRALFREKPE